MQPAGAEAGNEVALGLGEEVLPGKQEGKQNPKGAPLYCPAGKHTGLACGTFPDGVKALCPVPNSKRQVQWN